jgi:predicted ester cyclase
MPTTQNDAIIDRIHKELATKGDLSAIDGVYDARFVNYAMPGAPAGLEAMHERHQAIRAAFPDWHETIENICAKGDKIVVRSVVSGTHTGEWLGIAPTGKQVRAMRITIFRMVAGKIVERWGSQDELGLMQQLNAIPLHVGPIASAR